LIIDSSFFMKTLHGNLLGWIKPLSADEFVGAFVGEGAVPDARRGFPGRAPAMQLCSTLDEARQWVEEQAAAFNLPVKWVSEISTG
jgi:hypothetical protein